jgi:hypothetical protein
LALCFEGGYCVPGSRETSKSEEASSSATMLHAIDYESEVTEAQLLAIAKVAGNKYFDLKFEMVKVHEYEERYPKSLQDRLFNILIDWKQDQMYPAVEYVVSACNKAGVRGGVRRALLEVTSSS